MAGAGSLRPLTLMPASTPYSDFSCWVYHASNGGFQQSIPDAKKYGPPSRWSDVANSRSFGVNPL
jgi:hypothetical protein